MKLVILDRDGVINYDSPNYIKSPEEWQALPGSLEAISLLNKAGIKVAIATNQSGIFRELFSEEILNSIHQKLKDQLTELNGHIDAIFYCPHNPNNTCDCRKPKPGLLQQALERFNILPGDACFVGDSYKDIQAAQIAGCQPILVETGNGKKVIEKYKSNLKNSRARVYKDLYSFVTNLLT